MNYTINMTNLKKMIILISILCIILSGYTFLSNYNKILIFISGAFSILTIKFDFKNRGKTFKNNMMLYTIWVIYLILNTFFSVSFESSLSLLIKIISSYFILFVEWNNDKLNVIFKSIRYICLFYALSIFIELISPNTILKLASLIEPSRVMVIKDELTRGIYSGLVGEKGFAAYLMIVGAIIEVSQYIKKNKFNIYNIIFIFIYIIATILTGKRMLTLILIMELVLAFNYFNVKGKLIKGMLLGIVTIIFTITIFTMIPQTTNIIERFLEMSDDTTSGGRKMFWDVCIEMFEEKSAIGYGLNTFNEIFTQKTNYKFNGESWKMHAHNIYYQLLGETGIIGLSLFVVVILKNFRDSINLYKKANLNGIDKMTLWVSIALQALFIVYGLSGNTLYYDAQLICYLFSLSLFYTSCKKI